MEGSDGKEGGEEWNREEEMKEVKVRVREKREMKGGDGRSEGRRGGEGE